MNCEITDDIEGDDRFMEHESLFPFSATFRKHMGDISKALILIKNTIGSQYQPVSIIYIMQIILFTLVLESFNGYNSF